MDTTLDKEENQKNIYVIKRNLSTYKMLPGERSWTLNIGQFRLSIKLCIDDYWGVTAHGNNVVALSHVNIIDFDIFDIDLTECANKEDNIGKYVYINRDHRFKDYLPIQYNVIETPTGGRINQSDGKNIPLLHLMELIRLLYRLNNLAVFE